MIIIKTPKREIKLFIPMKFFNQLMADEAKHFNGWAIIDYLYVLSLNRLYSVISGE